jgi:thiol-disulfide isomerase/thioredoxin
MATILKKILFIFILIYAFTSLSAQIPIMTFDEFEPHLHKNNDTTYVINFWATWCKPCIEEIPAFEELNRKFSDQPVNVLMVSLDFVRNLNSRLIPFIEKNNMKAEVILLNDPKSHIWIEKVSSNWTGSIPATIIYNRNKRSFYERTFTYDELENELRTHL